MRNTLGILLFMIVSFVSNGQAGDPITQIELSKISRGYQEYIRITCDSLHVLTVDRKSNRPAPSYSRKLEKKEWTDLVSALGFVKLKDIPALVSPSMKRAHDGAMHATITVYTKDGKSYSHGYDDEDPHEALQPLRKSIRDLSNREQKP